MSSQTETTSKQQETSPDKATPLAGLDAMQQRLDQLRRSLDSAGETFTHALSESERQRRAELEAHGRLDQREAELNDRAEELNRQNETLERSKADLEAARKDLADQRATTDRQRDDLERRAAEIEAEEGRLTELQTELRHRREAIDRDRAQLDADLEAARRRSATLDKRAAELDEREQTLTEQAQRNEERSANLDEQRRKLDAEREALEIRQQKLNERGDGGTGVDEETLAAERRDLQQQHESLAAERSGLDAQRESLDADTSKLAEQRQALEAERQALTAEREQLDRQRAEADEKARAALDAERRELADQAEAVKAERAAMKAESKTVLAAKKKLDEQKREQEDEIRRRNEAEQEKLAAARAALKADRAKLAAERRELDQLRRDLADVDLDAAATGSPIASARPAKNAKPPRTPILRPRLSRLIVDLVLVVMLVCGGIGIWFYFQRSETYEQQVASIDKALTSLRDTALLQGATGEYQVTRAEFPLGIEQNWFEQLPVNALVPAGTPWLETAAKQQANLANPTVIVAGPDHAAFWYNPYRGVIRARVPEKMTRAMTIDLYNQVNKTSITVGDVQWPSE